MYGRNELVLILEGITIVILITYLVSLLQGISKLQNSWVFLIDSIDFTVIRSG